MLKAPVAVIILDGFGLREEHTMNTYRLGIRKTDVCLTS